MIIRKLFKFEGAHIVRNCTSVRCRENIHGHSYIVEVFLTSDKLDNGYMVTDFARLAKIKQVIDAFDHSYILWDQEDAEFKDFVYKYNKRIVEIPVSPSAEGFALLFLKISDSIINKMERVNGEGNVKISSVRVHETATGYAEAFIDDLKMADFEISDVHYSDAILEEWRD
ncbi:MAG: 6-carboxytetrahydropterin synthase [Marinifilaceae bacterium]|nr:6-carboxytetrahydropterin synthase [Marinifilaceae bacterium]